MANALIEKMHFDIDEGYFSSILLDKLNEDNGKNDSCLSSKAKEKDSDKYQNTGLSWSSSRFQYMHWPF
jgi:hypothetical protein